MQISRLLIFSSVVMAACTNDPVTPTPREPAAIELVTTLPTEVQIGTPITLKVRVVDAEGLPVPGVTVTFGQGIGTGTFTPAELTTGADGVATTTWQITASNGFAFAGAQAGSVMTHFEVSTTPAPAAFLTLEGPDTLTGTPGTTPDDGIFVRVLDAFGNGVSGVSLSGSATSGTVYSGGAPTDASGRAQMFWQIGPELGVQTLTIRSPGLNDLILPTIVLSDASDRSIAVSTNRSHACRILPQGAAECWGDNTNGRLGNGTDQPQVGPVTVQGGHHFVAISIGGLNDTQRNGTCGVNLIGEVWCWGAAPDGSPPGIPLRLQISQRFRFVEQGESHACGLDYEGIAWCWGANGLGQLGVGDNNGRGAPTRVDTPATFRDLAVGANHTCGLTRRGQVLCWGLGLSGRLGDGTTTNRTRPTPIASSLRFITLDVGAAHACAIAIGGGMHCWGSDGNGRVTGNGIQGGTVSTPQPVRPDLHFTRVAAGVAGTCGITTSGAGWCWGSNSSHQLADSARTQLKPAGPMAGKLEWLQIALGETSGCGITITIETRCWGFNGDGVVGQEDRWRFTTPQPVAGGHLFTDIATGFSHSCGLKFDGTTWCWGNNQVGVLGEPALSRAAEPWRVTTVPPFVAITSANNSACGLTVGGSVQCWGAAIVGDGPIVNSPIPLAVALPEPAMTLHQGWQMGCATLQSGDVWCWGPSNGTTTTAAEPALVSTPEPLFNVSVGLGWACGLGASGSAYCWNRRADAAAPYPVTPLPGGPTYTAVAAVTNGVCAITGSGTSFCTGAGGVLEPLNPPLPLTSIEPGSYVTCGRTAGGNAVCWGNNEFGQVGRGDLSEIAGPSTVQGGLSWTKLAPSTGHSCGLTPGGTAYCWGSAQTGELGNGVTRYFPTPVVVP